MVGPSDGIRHALLECRISPDGAEIADPLAKASRNRRPEHKSPGKLVLAQSGMRIIVQILFEVAKDGGGLLHS